MGILFTTLLCKTSLYLEGGYVKEVLLCKDKSLHNTQDISQFGRVQAGWCPKNGLRRHGYIEGAWTHKICARPSILSFVGQIIAAIKMRLPASDQLANYYQ
eukprot:1089285-Amphidinium_carterae.1